MRIMDLTGSSLRAENHVERLRCLDQRFTGKLCQKSRLIKIDLRSLNFDIALFLGGNPSLWNGGGSLPDERRGNVRTHT